MAIKSGELIHVGNLVLVDRIQTAGPGNLNIPTEKIYELGNYESVATVRDIPDLSFSMESLDVSCEVEAMLLGLDFGTLTAGQQLNLQNARPLDVVSQFKRGKLDANAFDVRASAAIPYLTLESMSYRFGLRDNASQNATLRGDSVFYAGASAYVQETAGSGAAGQVINFANAPIPYNGDNVAGTRYALAVTIVEDGKRLTPGAEYTETAPTTGATPTPGSVTIEDAVAADKTIRIVYQSLVVANYPQVSHAAASATRPAAVKGKDIEVRVGGNTITDRWSSIQSVNLDWRVTLERDEEMGNQQVVSQDFDVPEVNGSIDIKPRDAVELLDKIKQIGGVTGDEVVGPYTSSPLTLDVIIHSPDDGTVLKTLHVPDARFTLPGYQGRVQQKMTVSMGFESDGGTLLAINGARV